MDAPHLKLVVHTSFHQQLALVLLAAICACSLFVWPPLDSQLLWGSFITALFGFVCFFSYQFWQLRYWRHELTLTSAGEGYFGDQQRFQLTPLCWVTPIACFFYVKPLKQQQCPTRLMIIWFDMLSPLEYRHLCRLIISCSKTRA